HSPRRLRAQPAGHSTGGSRRDRGRRWARELHWITHRLGGGERARSGRRARAPGHSLAHGRGCGSRAEARGRAGGGVLRCAPRTGLWRAVCVSPRSGGDAVRASGAHGGGVGARRARAALPRGGRWGGALRRPGRPLDRGRSGAARERAPRGDPAPRPLGTGGHRPHDCGPGHRGARVRTSCRSAGQMGGAPRPAIARFAPPGWLTSATSPRSNEPCSPIPGRRTTSPSASRRAYRSSWPSGGPLWRGTSSRTAPPTREKSWTWESRSRTDGSGSLGRWSSECSRHSPAVASGRCTSRCGRRTRRPGVCMSRSASARSRDGRITTVGQSRTQWYCGPPFLQRGGLQNFSTSGVSLIDRITCGSYTVVALGPDPPSVWRSVVSRSLNKVMLIGNLGADPEVRSTNNGSRVATVSLATSRQWTGQGGEKQEKTEWHRVICWNNKGKGAQLADLAEKYMKKGDRIYVEGRVEYRTWEDREKQTRYTTEIIAREVILLSS